MRDDPLVSSFRKSRYLAKRGWWTTRLIFPFLHVCLCAAIALNPNHVEGNWRWFPVFYIDFPFSILLLPSLTFVSPWLAFGIFGTLWWFLLNIILLLFSKLILKRAG